MIDAEQFYLKLKSVGLFTDFTQAQVDTINAILSECDKQGVTDKRQIAYIFGTAYWECHNPKKPSLRMTPMEEFGGYGYLIKKPYYPYYGRGLSQLTWLVNYKKEGKRLNLDLVNDPNLILDIPTAANSHVYCMLNGVYTGRKLSDYINDTKCDYLGARKIINGTNKAAEIMAIAQKFESALQ